MTTTHEPVYTRRQYLVHKSIERGAMFSTAIEAVSTTLLANPKWDTDETMTYPEWEAFYRDKAEA